MIFNVGCDLRAQKLGRRIAISKAQCLHAMCVLELVLGVKKNFCYFSSLITFYHICE